MSVIIASSCQVTSLPKRLIDSHTAVFLSLVGTHSQACNSPQLFGRDYTGQIECPFNAQIVSWFRDNKPIINGTDDLYQREERLSNGNIRSKLFFSLVRMQHAGFYTCKANTSHNNTRSCKIQVIVRCKY